MKRTRVGGACRVYIILRMLFPGVRYLEELLYWKHGFCPLSGIEKRPIRYRKFDCIFNSKTLHLSIIINIIAMRQVLTVYRTSQPEVSEIFLLHKFRSTEHFILCLIKVNPLHILYEKE